MKHFIFVVLMIVHTITAAAHDFEQEGIYYNVVNVANNEVGVTYAGRYENMKPNYSGNVVIPSSVNYNGKSYTITTICEDCFTDCVGMTSITLPETLTTIEDYGFDGCSGLTSLQIPWSVDYIGDSAFTGCENITSINIPEKITEIRYCTFEDCKSLADIYCYCLTPPEADFVGLKDTLTVHVFAEYISAYEASDWNRFKIIGDLSTAGIRDIYSSKNHPIKYFDINGISVAVPSNGIFIKVQGSEAKIIKF